MSPIVLSAILLSLVTGAAAPRSDAEDIFPHIKPKYGAGGLGAIRAYCKDKGIGQIGSNTLRYFRQPMGVVSMAVEVDLAVGRFTSYPGTHDKGEKTLRNLGPEQLAELKRVLRSERFTSLPVENPRYGMDGYSILIESSLDGQYAWKLHWVPEGAFLQVANDIEALLRKGVSPIDESALKQGYDAFVKSLGRERIAEDYAGAVRQLDSSDPQTVIAGLQTLAATGDPAVIPWVVPHLDSGNAEVRILAGASLEKVVSGHELKRRDDRYPDRIIIKPLGPGDLDLRPVAWVILKMLRKPDDGNTHAYAATMIGYLHLKEFDGELRTLLKSRHPAVTRAAQTALKQLDATNGEMRIICVSDDKHGFVLAESGQPFVPWGFNYDHDENGRLLEDYWDKEWPKVEEDFQEMKQLGANVVRIHLQTGKFMKAANQPDEATLDRLGQLVALAEKIGLYLDITGLACYRKKEVPKWYDDLSERDRWDVQARFWEAVARRCAKSPAIFCYDLMNEPVVPGGTRKPGDWLGPSFLGLESGYFVQFITLEQKGRARPEIARQWCHKLVAAIRKQDQRHLVTVGLVPWSLDRPGLTSGFVPKEIVPELDFIAVHLYPEKGKVKEAMETLSGFALGKPVVIEEMAPMRCSIPEFEQFLDDSKKTAAGWIGFYWGKTPEQYRQSGTLQDAIMLGWLEMFQKRAKAVSGERTSGGQNDR